MKSAFIAGLAGAVIGGAISAGIGYVAPLPHDSVVNAIANGAAGFFSGFFGGFMAIVVQGLGRKRTRAA